MEKYSKNSVGISTIVTRGKERCDRGEIQGAGKYIFALRISSDEGKKGSGITHFLNLRILFKSSNVEANPRFPGHPSKGKKKKKIIKITLRKILRVFYPIHKRNR